MSEPTPTPPPAAAPATFTDTAGREWRLEITAYRLRRLRELLGYSPALVATEEGLAEWRGLECTRDPERFADVVAVVLAEDQEKRNVTREDFEKAFNEDTYSSAIDAWRDALINFCPWRDAVRAIFGAPTAAPTSTSNNGPSSSPAPPDATPAPIASAA